MHEGDHFGELALIYKCTRTATVISKQYNTFARISASKFRMVASQFPEYAKLLRINAMNKYRDSEIEFRKKILRRVEYLSRPYYFDTKSPEYQGELLFKLILSMERHRFEKNDVLLKSNDPAIALLMVESGKIEVSTHFEGNRFSLDVLKRGSLINHRAFFLKDLNSLDFTCLTNARLLGLTHEKMKKFIVQHADEPIGRDLQLYQHKILKQAI